MNTLPSAAVAAAVLGLLLWAALRPDPLPTTARPATVPAAASLAQPAQALQPAAGQATELAELRRQVAALSAQVEQLRQAVAARPALMPAPAAAPVPRPADPPDAAQEAEAQGVDAAQREQAFRREPDDQPRWAREQDAAIRQALAAATGLPPARAVECRARSCRVEFTGSAEEVEAALPTLLLQLGERLGQATPGRIDAGDGHWATVLYLQP